jgi:hypothetical protein
MIGAVATAQGLGAFVGVVVGPMLYKADELAERLNFLWPGHNLFSHLLPVIAAAILLSATWLASLLVVRGRSPVLREA